MHLRSYQQLLCNAVALGDFCHRTKTCDRLRVILGLMLVLTTPPLKKDEVETKGDLPLLL